MYIHGPHLTHGVQPSMLPVLQNQDDTTSHVYTWSPSDAWCLTINVTSSTKSDWHNFTCIYMVPIWRMVYNHQCYQFYRIRMTQLHMYIHGPIWRMVYNHQCYQFYRIKMTQLHMYNMFHWISCQINDQPICMKYCHFKLITHIPTHFQSSELKIVKTCHIFQ